MLTESELERYWRMGLSEYYQALDHLTKEEREQVKRYCLTRGSKAAKEVKELTKLYFDPLRRVKLWCRKLF